MKYANFMSRTEIVFILFADVFFFVIWIWFGYLLIFVPDLVQDGVFEKVIYWIMCIGLGAFIIEIGIFQRRYIISEDGIVEQVWFINHITKWSDYYAWESIEYRGRKFICAYKTKKIPILKRWYEVYIPKTFPMTYIRYTQERYTEFKEYADKNHIPELREEG